MHDAASAFKITKQGIPWGFSFVDKDRVRVHGVVGERGMEQSSKWPNETQCDVAVRIEHITVTHAQRSTVLLERQGGMGRLGATPWDAKMLYYLQAYDDHLNLLDRLILAQPPLGLSSHSRMIDDISKNNSSS
ncbi:hypothetical protein B296_00002234 [Ensete ventricosum]|uniref:Uncharacterized protein n=1 Tax=Ensete ventricosum TaxID=4639 RepID=A0A427B8R1_ENSVE|nr:hypothetical protein B296_00002234 [Ensete ventricosum]